MEMVIGKINKEVQDFATNIEQATSRLNSEFEQATSRFNTELEQASLLPQAFCEGSTSSPPSWPFSFKRLLLILDSWIFDSSTTSCQVQWVVLGWFKLCCDVCCRVWWWDWDTMFLWKLDHAIITGVKERPITSLRGTCQMQEEDVAIFCLFLNSGTCMVSDRL